jgi:nucleoid-associated protein YgaU
MPQPLKATFQRVNDNGTLGAALPVSFNPTEYTLNKGAQLAEIPIPGLDSPILQFVRGQTETLSLDLFFDSTEKGVGDTAESVTKTTDQFYQLIKIEGTKHAPPIVFFSWGDAFPGQRPYALGAGDSGGGGRGNRSGGGAQQRHGFKCVVESVRQRFTLFSTQGVPLRATLTVSLKEYKTLKEQVDELNKTSPDHTHSHVVQSGETLSQISWSIYNDPSQWRAIADANNLTDPLALQPGAVLTIPTLR